MNDGGMKRDLGWGILATGWIAEIFTEDLNSAGLRVAAVGSRAIGSAQAFAARFGIPKAHGSYEALVTDPDVDIIYVATPHPMHVANALLAIEAGFVARSAFPIPESRPPEASDLIYDEALYCVSG